jgi:hypothetical protein
MGIEAILIIHLMSSRHTLYVTHRGHTTHGSSGKTMCLLLGNSDSETYKWDYILKQLLPACRAPGIGSEGGRVRDAPLPYRLRDTCGSILCMCLLTGLDRVGEHFH